MSKYQINDRTVLETSNIQSIRKLDDNTYQCKMIFGRKYILSKEQFDEIVGNSTIEESFDNVSYRFIGANDEVIAYGFQNGKGSCEVMVPTDPKPPLGSVLVGWSVNGVVDDSISANDKIVISSDTDFIAVFNKSYIQTNQTYVRVKEGIDDIFFIGKIIMSDAEISTATINIKITIYNSDGTLNNTVTFPVENVSSVVTGLDPEFETPIENVSYALYRIGGLQGFIGYQLVGEFIVNDRTIGSSAYTVVEYIA